MSLSASTLFSKRRKGSSTETHSGKAPSENEADANSVLRLQRSAGNRVVSSLLSPAKTDGTSGENNGSSVQRSGIPQGLPIGQPGDHFEHEADRVADQIATKPIQSDANGDASSDSRSGPKSNNGGNAVSNLPGSAEPLPEDVRATFEPRLGFDLSGVRVHKDSQAADTASQLGAHAFTAGRDIVFGEGEYSPQTAAGQRLLAHELVHVGQQQGVGNQQSTGGDGAQLSSAPTQIQGSFFGDVWEGIKGAARAVGGAIVSAGRAVGSALSTAAQAVGRFISGAARWIGERVRDLSQWVVSLIQNLPARLARLASTIVDGLAGVASFIPGAIRALASGGLSGFASWLWERAKRGGAWVLTLLSRVFDVLGGPEALEFVWHMITRARPLSGTEITAASSVLGPNAIRWGDVRVSEGGLLSIIFALNGGRAFTTFHTINLAPNETIDVVVHELAHVYQYERAGSVYIGQAIHAQATVGYGYGRGAGLVRDKNAGKHYRDYNREQQAQIAQDYYKEIIVGGGTGLTADERAAYEYYIGELRAGDL